MARPVDKGQGQVGLGHQSEKVWGLEELGEMKGMDQRVPLVASETKTSERVGPVHVHACSHGDGLGDCRLVDTGRGLGPLSRPCNGQVGGDSRSGQVKEQVTTARTGHNTARYRRRKTQRKSMKLSMSSKT